MTVNDFALLPEVIKNYDHVVDAGINKIGREVIRYEKRINEEYIFVVEEVRTGRNQLAFQTMWKKKATDKAGSPSLTSETLQGMNQASHAEPASSSFIENISATRVKVNNERDPLPRMSETTALEPDARNAQSISQNESANLGDVKHTTDSVTSFSSGVLEKEVTSNTKVKGSDPDVLARASASTKIDVNPDKAVLPKDGALQAADALKITDIAAYLEKELDIPIRIGKLGSANAGAEGIYKAYSEVARTRVANV